MPSDSYKNGGSKIKQQHEIYPMGSLKAVKPRLAAAPSRLNRATDERERNEAINAAIARLSSPAPTALHLELTAMHTRARKAEQRLSARKDATLPM